MSFFRRQGLVPDGAGRSGEVISSVLAKEMRVNGEIHFKGKARIDGTVEGNIRGEYLVLSESGKVFGDLELVNLVCHGTIEGNIQAQQVTIHETAAVHGNLLAVSLTVEPGARLSGEITSSQQQQAAEENSHPLPEADQD